MCLFLYELRLACAPLFMVVIGRAVASSRGAMQKVLVEILSETSVSVLLKRCSLAQM